MNTNPELPCAWCLKEKGQTMKPETPMAGKTSHSICQRHLQEMFAILDKDFSVTEEEKERV